MMMNRLNFIYATIIVAFLLAVGVNSPLHTQVRGVLPTFNVIDSMFIRVPAWRGAKWSERKNFLDRTQLSVGYAYNGNLENEKGSSITASYGYWAAPVHGVELSYNSYYTQTFSLNYMFNLTSYASRREGFGAFDLILKGGLATDLESAKEWKDRVGFSTAIRAQSRVLPATYIYVEPSVIAFKSRPVTTISAGFSFDIGGVRDFVARYRTKRSIDRETEEYRNRTPLFAVKTNLLFDAATIANVEVEVPIGDKWSVAGEWIFPWWLTKDNGNAIQVLSGNLEEDIGLETEDPPVMTGWFAGFYAGGGLFDLQYKDNGYQGEFYIAAGVSGGYAHHQQERY